MYCILLPDVQLLTRPCKQGRLVPRYHAITQDRRDQPLISSLGLPSFNGPLVPVAHSEARCETIELTALLGRDLPVLNCSHAVKCVNFLGCPTLDLIRYVLNTVDLLQVEGTQAGPSQVRENLSMQRLNPLASNPQHPQRGGGYANRARQEHYDADPRREE
jgi:hypothetical protein